MQAVREIQEKMNVLFLNHWINSLETLFKDIRLEKIIVLFSVEVTMIF